MDQNFELNLLIIKYLRHGVCPEAAQLLEDSLAEKEGGIPSRVDWRGNKHRQTLAQLEKQFPKVRSNHLLDICKRLENRSLLSLPRATARESKSFSPLQYSLRSQLGFKQNRSNVYNSVYSKLHLLRRTVGHLSAVFCLLFDKTGRYVFTGADDLLVKMWGTSNGRLYFTFRGASAEISDMAISEDNRLLAAGSTDKIIRVWCLLSAAPVAVLAKHTGTITALHFCPATISGVPPYLAATSGDGTVSFWKFTYNKSDKHKRPVFDPEPTRYHEKMRPGGAQMICASFSPGGLFLATGSADHHVRVYMMDGKEGPVKVLEQEAHSEQVDSLQWANKPNLRFASGSKDGTARIWNYSCGEWHSVQLIIKGEDGRTLHYNPHRKCEEAFKVTMTSWTRDDAMVITAISDASLCAWDSQTRDLLYRLKGHTDEVYVLEPHPINPDIILSGAHDGNVIVWEISSKRELFRYQNDIEGQGHGAIYDAKWCSDNMTIAASDSHGHVLFFGATSAEPYLKYPEEMFFHTDYRPLLRDTAHYVVDEQSQCAPHLLPPPFLVDIEGNPYPADVQRLVPGREKLSDQECLVPNLTEAETTSPNRRMSVDRRASGDSANRVGVEQPVLPASNIDQLIEELAATTPREEEIEVPAESAANPMSEHSYASPGRRPTNREVNNRSVQMSLPAPASQELTRSVWRKRELIPASFYACAKSDHARRRDIGHQERIFFKVELSKRKNKADRIEARHQGIERIIGGRRGARAARIGRTRRDRPAATTADRAGRRQTEETEETREHADEDEEEEDEDDQEEDFENSDLSSDTSLDESDLESGDSSSSSSTEYSDWGANNLTPPQRTARKSGRVTGSSKPPSSDEETSQAEQTSEAAKPGPSRVAKLNRKKNYSFNPNKLDDIPPEYLPSDWLAQFVPNKSPYFPQMGDEVMYIKQGHMGYINLVKKRNSYRLNMREQQWLQRDDIRDIELVKVIGMKHEIRPPRLCCLKLAILDAENNTLTGENFSIKYHDMNDVLDFLVLRHNYEASVQVQWKPGDRYRCQIEDAWWFGTVLQVSPFAENKPDSPFLSIKCLWDSGDEERLSPWDLDPVNPGQIGYEKTDQSVGVTRAEIEQFLYQPLPDEWRGLDHRAECRRISAGLAEVMALGAAEPFNYPVDLTLYPDYMLEIEYPMDFSLIKSRLDNQFYRRTTAIQFDVRYIATNAECYNRPKTDIVKNARIVTDLVLRIIQDPNLTDVTGEYHRLVKNFKWEDTQEPKANKTSGRQRKKSAVESPPNPKQWKHDCNDLLQQMFSNPDSEPFREPVSEIDFPDYARIITTPMDLAQVQECLRVGEYKTPLEFRDDVDLIFSNSLRYNTDRKSVVAGMTKRLKAFFLDKFQAVITDWRRVNRKLTFLKKKGKSPSVTPRKKVAKEQRRGRKQDREENRETSEDEDPGEGTSRANQRRGKPIKYEEESEEETSDEEEEEIRPRRNRKKPERFRDDSDSDTKPSDGRRKLDLDISETSDTDSKVKNKGKGKGKGKSTKVLSKNQSDSRDQNSSHNTLEEEEEESSEEPDLYRKKDRKKQQTQSRQQNDSSPNRSREMESKPAIKTEDSDEDVPISRRRNLTPKKSGGRRAAKLTSEDEESTEEETETESTPDSSEDEDEWHIQQKRTSREKSRKRKLSAARADPPRPRRQATARALSKFQASDSDAYESIREETSRPVNSRRRAIDRNRGAAQRSVQAAERVTISAADSSTDPRSTAPQPRRIDNLTDSEEEEQRHGRMQRRGKRPDYSEDNDLDDSSRPRNRPAGMNEDNSRRSRRREGDRIRRHVSCPDYNEDDVSVGGRQKRRGGHLDYAEEEVQEPRRKKRRMNKNDRIYSEDDSREAEDVHLPPQPRRRAKPVLLQDHTKEDSREAEDLEPRRRSKPVRLQEYVEDDSVEAEDVDRLGQLRRKSKSSRVQNYTEDSGEVEDVGLSEQPRRRSKAARLQDYTEDSVEAEDMEEQPRRRSKPVRLHDYADDTGEAEDIEQQPRRRSKPARLQDYADDTAETEDIEEQPRRRSKPARLQDYAEDTGEAEDVELRRKSKNVRLLDHGEEDSPEAEQNIAPRWKTSSGRVQDYESTEMIREGKRSSMKNPRRYEEPDGRLGTERGKRKRKEVTYKEDTEMDDRRDRSKRNRGFKSSRRHQSEPNYRDESSSEDDEVRIPYNRKSANNAGISGGSSHEEDTKKRGKSTNQTESREETGISSQDEDIRQKREKKSAQTGSKDVDEEQEMSDHLHEEEEEDSIDADYRKRKKSRVEVSSRPQRLARKSGRSRYVESSDEDLNSRRKHRIESKRSRRRVTVSEDSSEDENTSGLGGVSSRGRVRRPNPRLMD